MFVYSLSPTPFPSLSSLFFSKQRNCSQVKLIVSEGAALPRRTDADTDRKITIPKLRLRLVEAEAGPKDCFSRLPL